MVRLTKKKRKTTQNTKIRYEKGDITNNLTEIKKFTENTINNGMVTGNLEGMEKSLESHKLPNLTQEEIEKYE